MRQIVLDLETYDPELKESGTDAHCRRFGGYVFMVGLKFMDTGEKYIRPWDDESKAHVRSLFNEGHEWIGAHLKYDLGWLLSDSVLLPEHTHYNLYRDILINAPLIDETQPPYFYSLDAQCQHYNLPTKPIEKLLADAASRGIKCDAKTVRGQLYKLSREVVAEYLEHDLDATGAVNAIQEKLLADRGLLRVWELESRLLPVLAMMENRGVRVDVEQAERLYEEAYQFIQGVTEQLRRENGGKDVPLTSSNALISFLLDRGHKLPHTPSSTQEKPKYGTDAATLGALAKVDPLVESLLQARRAEKIAKDFCKGAIIASHHNGRIHANINQIIGRKDSGDGQGVRFGRLSMSNPNLQQVPKKDKVTLDGIGGLGSAMRRIFIAEEGCQLMSGDFSSQEPRWIIHWAETWKMPGAERIGDMYRKDPTISSHDIVASGIEADMPYKEKRALAKIINLGKGYEMGINKLTANLVAEGVDPAQAERIMADFDRNFPHVSAASRTAMAAAERLGYVRTYYGRMLHFNDWEPVKYGAGPAMPYDAAYERYTLQRRIPIRRAFCYRAFNRIVQGSSADQTKAAMVSLWYDHGILPYLQVHDELVDGTIRSMETVKTYKYVMENVTPLTIPSLTEVKLGPNWKDGELYAA